jgi:hypothetical protein
MLAKLVTGTVMLAGMGAGEIVDRIAVTVDREVITAGQIEEEVRVTAFIEQQTPQMTLENRRQAADRLVEQVLVRREMALSRYPKPTDADSAAYLAELINKYGGEAPFKEALARYSLNDRVLRNHLTFQITTLRFLEYRFRPDVDVTDKDIQDAYAKEVTEWRQKNSGEPPSLEQSRDAIKKKIFDDHVENEFSTWLEESRKQVKVNYLEPELQ